MTTITPQLFATYAADPKAFRDDLLIDHDGDVCRFGDVMADFQRADFAAIDPALMRCNGRSSEPAKMRVYLERGRGASKTTDIAAVCISALVFSIRPLKAFVYAADRDQARLLLQAIQTLLRLNPWLASVLTIQANSVVVTAAQHPGEGGTLTVESSDVGSSFGILPDLVVAEELVHWEEGGAELWHSLLTSAAKRSGCLLLVVSNAGFASTWQERVRETARTDAAWVFRRLDTPPPWMGNDRLAELRRMLPEVAFSRLVLNIWSSGGGDALREADVLAAFDDRLQPMTGRERGYLFVAGVDLGLTRDCSAVVVLAVPEGGTAGRIRLAHHKLWRPILGRKIDLIDVEQHLLDLDEQFELEYVGFDNWQMESLAQRLEADSNHRRRNQRRVYWSKPWMREVPPTAPNLREQATLVIESFVDHRLQFYPCEPLKRDLLKLRCEEKSYGIRLSSPRDADGHGDSFAAFANALLMAHELAGKKPVRVDSGDDDGETAYERALRQFQYRAAESERYQELLAAEGSDYSGSYEWKQFMRRFGRA